MAVWRAGLAGLVAIALMAVDPALSRARVIECPATIRVKADNPPAPWKTPTYNNYTLLNFAHTSMSCAAGACSLSCAYTMYPACGPSVSISSFTFLVDHVKPGQCQEGRDGRGFECT
jgi:hypothetical protein